MNTVAEHRPLRTSGTWTMGRRFSSAQQVRPLRQNEGAALIVKFFGRLVDELDSWMSATVTPSHLETSGFNANAVIARRPRIKSWPFVVQRSSAPPAFPHRLSVVFVRMPQVPAPYSDFLASCCLSHVQGVLSSNVIFCGSP